MKKCLSSISIVLSSALLVSMAAPLTAFATGDEISQKDITSYLYSKDKTETLTCLFKSSMPDMPYISTSDFCENIFKGETNEVKNPDGTYTVTNPDGSMVIDTVNDTIYFDEFESFISSEADSDGTMLHAPYSETLGMTIEGETKSLTLDLGAYDIDILEYEGRSYFPVSSVSLLFSITYDAAEYADGCIYFIHCSDMMTDDSYFDRTSVYEDDHRSREMIDLTYNELCFAVDKLYGRPSKAEIAGSIEEKGFDKTLDEYSDDTRKAKELILSDSKTDFIIGLCYLSSVFDDGGHTSFMFPLADSVGNYSDSAVGTVLMDKLTDFSDPDAEKLVSLLFDASLFQDDMPELYETRSNAYEKYETVKVWDDPSQAQLIRSGNTAVFAFDSFMNETVDNFKWSLDYAKDNGIKRFVLDVSCNAGGSSDIVMYMMTMMLNKSRDNNTASMRTLYTITGNISNYSYELDLNLDGEINDLDKDVYYDLEYAVLTSNISFSCGNLLPALARDNGIAVIGGTSGGGACALSINFTAESMPYTLSSYDKFISADNGDVDSGIVPDYDLTKKVVTESGEKVDYSALYDIAGYEAMIDEFYGVSVETTDEPSGEPSDEPSDEPSQEAPAETYDEPSDTPAVAEPSKESSDEPAKDNPDKPESGASQTPADQQQAASSFGADSDQTAANTENYDTVTTGENGTAMYMTAVMLTAFAAVFIFRRRRNNDI